ncbi:MAG: 2,3-bisphosphoglycerate-dependent phosphoglycerate mutase [Propionibacteriaceae bacterium]|nr:2,3-bisphosphoglycerate-dependent phosphoglycerate mutase [Propionibacteriaceae bacterium]
MNGTLVLLRHGESTFNAAAVFTGLLDADLTEGGARQVEVAAGLMAGAGLSVDLLVVSPMVRAVRTASLLFDALGHQPAETIATWRLVERDYGCLTHVSKVEARERYGEEAFFTWRRTVHGRPPAASADQRATWVDPPPVPESGPLVAGDGESLADVIARVLPVWTDVLAPRLRAGQTVLVASHGNTLRALVTALLSLPDAEAEQLNIPAGHPLVFDVDARGAVAAGRYLDEDAAAVAEAAVAAEGGT